MDADRLTVIPLFAALSKKEREQVARWSDEVDVPAGKHLVSEGQFAHEFFVIENGTAEVTASMEDEMPSVCEQIRAAIRERLGR